MRQFTLPTVKTLKLVRRGLLVLVLGGTLLVLGQILDRAGPGFPGAAPDSRPGNLPLFLWPSAGQAASEEHSSTRSPGASKPDPGAPARYETTLDGSEEDNLAAMTVDEAGNVYLVGNTTSPDFPTVNQIPDATGNSQDAFVTKLDAQGHIVFSTYLGGPNNNDQARDIALDSAGNIYVVGQTSRFFPITNALYPDFPGGALNGFVAKLSPQGTLLYSTYYGGEGSDIIYAVAVDQADAVYIAGSTNSAGLGTPDAFASTNQGGVDGFVAKLNPAGTERLWALYLGGSELDYIQDMAVDKAGNAHLVGVTRSTNFPKQAAFQNTPGGNGDGFVAKLNAAGDDLLYSSYLGGENSDNARRIALDPEGNAVILGDTISTRFITHNPLQADPVNGLELFLTKVTPAGDLFYSTYLGGSGVDLALGLTVDSAGIAYLTGATNSPDFPTVEPQQPDLGDGQCGLAACPDAFLTRVSAVGDRLLYSSYWGDDSGTDLQQLGVGLGLDAAGRVYLGLSVGPVTPAVIWPQAGQLTAGSVLVTSLSGGDRPPLSLTVDLNGPPAGIGYTVALTDFTQTITPLAVVDSHQLTVSAPITATLQSATVTLTTRPDGGDERLDADVGGSGLSKNYDSSSGVLTLTGPAEAVTFQTALRTVTYQNSRFGPDRRARSITFVVSDELVNSAPAVATVFEVRGRVYLPAVVK